MESELTGCEVAVVGAGAVGCAVAWRLAQGGLRTVLVERARPGAEASGAAAGILACQHEGPRDGALFRLLLRSERLWGAFAEELLEAGGDVAHRRCGAFELAFDAEGAQELRERARWQAQQGLAVEGIDAAELRGRAPGLARDVLSALYLPEAAQVDAQRLSGALYACALRAGVRPLVGEARRVSLRAGRVCGVSVDGRELPAQAVVVAAGAWSSFVDGVGLSPLAVRPVRGQILCLEAPPPCPSVVLGPGGYVVPKADGRVLVGSTMEDAGFDRSVTAEGARALLDKAVRYCPELAKARLASSWAGLRPACADGLPALGPVPGVSGLHLAVGHLRNGIALTPLTAELLAASVRGEKLDLASELQAARLFT